MGRCAATLTQRAPQVAEKSAPKRFRLGCRRFERAARLAPRAEAARDVRDGTEAHAMRGLRGERRTPAAGAEKHEALVLREDRLVVGARGVDPEFEHAARTMKRAGHAPFAVKLADVAHVDEGDVVAPVKGDGLFDRQGLDLALGVVDERPIAVLNFLRHGAVRPDT